MLKVPLDGLYLALVSILLGSLPWLGSVRPKQPRISPLAVGQKHIETVFIQKFFTLKQVRFLFLKTNKRSYQAGAGTSLSGHLCRTHWLGAWPVMTGHSWLTDIHYPLSPPLWQSSHRQRNWCRHIRNLREEINFHEVWNFIHNLLGSMNDFKIVAKKTGAVTLKYSWWQFWLHLPLMVGPRTPKSPISETISRWKSAAQCRLLKNKKVKWISSSKIILK